MKMLFRWGEIIHQLRNQKHREATASVGSRGRPQGQSSTIRVRQETGLDQSRHAWQAQRGEQEGGQMATGVGYINSRN